jgi:TPR repeat protein
MLIHLDSQGHHSLGRVCRLTLSAAVVLFIAMFAGVQKASSQSSPNDEQTIFPEQAAVIAGADIPILEKAAVMGSAEAAHKLATYYAMIRFDFRKAEYWTEIRVENGDRNARYDLGIYLSDDDDLLSHDRARFWLNQVVADGPPDLSKLAKDTLEGIDERDRKAMSQQH